VIELACALFAGGLFIYVFSPARDLAHGEQKSRLSYLRERKEAIYDNLRDLNFEYRAGKFPEADYATMRAGLEDEAAKVLSEIDSLQRK
jgi:hypothetical protein